MISEEKSVLIVEPDDTVASEWAEGFRDFHYNVDVVADDAQVVDRASEAKPDLIVLRLELGPERKSIGYKICKRIKDNEALGSVPVVLVSSEASEKDFEGHRGTGSRAQGYLRMPLDFDDLLDEVENLIGLPTPPVTNGKDLAAPAQVEAIKHELENSRAEAEELRDELAAKKKVVTKLKERIEALQSGTGGGEDLSATVAELEEEVASKKKVIGVLKTKIERLESAAGTVEEATSTAAELEDELAGKKKAIAALKTKIETLEEQVAASQTAVEEAEELREELAGKKKVIAKLKERIEGLEGGTQQFEVATAELQAKLESEEEELTSARDELEKVKTELEEERDARENAVNKLKKRIGDLALEADEAREAAQEAIDKLQHTEDERAELELKHQKELDSLKNYYEPKLKEAKETEKELASAEEKIDELEGNIEQLREKFAELKKEQKKAIAEVEKRHEAELKERDKEVAAVRKELQDTIDEKERMEKRVMKAYRRLRADETQLEKVRKALQLAMGVIEDKAAKKKKSASD